MKDFKFYFIHFFLDTRLPNSIGYTETAPAAIKTVQSCWDGHHITQTGFIIRAKMPPPPEPRFTLTAGWGSTQRDLLLWPEPNCQIFKQKYFNLKNLTVKFNQKYF